jgi:hypothetical protein
MRLAPIQPAQFKIEFVRLGLCNPTVQLRALSGETVRLFRRQGKGMKVNVRVEPLVVTLAQPGRLKPAPQETWPS